MGIPVEVASEIDLRLSEVAQTEGVRVLFAVESGSRAWGFPSRDSDYDVRFVYAHEPDWYLSVDLERRRDVIERPISDAIDLSGWDLRKALGLLAKSNPPLIEWLGSPIVYHEILDTRARMLAVLTGVHSEASSIYHYLHMARGNHREYLTGDTVWVKKYLYALRPLLAVRWIEQGRGRVPTEFDHLLATIDDQPELVAAVRRLVARKRDGDELSREPAVPAISAFLETELQRLAGHRPPSAPRGRDIEPLNALFRMMLRECWEEGTPGA